MDPNAPPTDLARNANQFAMSLWQHMPAGNLAVSPASIAIPLTIAWGGAKNATATQLGALLGLGGQQDIVLGRWGKLAKSLTASKDLTLKIANRLYGEKTYEIDTTYFTIARHTFDVHIEPVDFINSAETIRQQINTWVADQTEQRIKDLMPPRSVGPATKMVIVNAIYFLADWLQPFDKSQTQPRDFWVNGTTKATVPTMQQVGAFRYASANGASMIELPYQGNTMAMYVVAPDAKDGLPAIEKNLAEVVKALQPALANKQVLLTLPRFTIDPPEPLKLDKALQALGMTDAFDPAKADFTGLANPKDPNQRMFISGVIHKAFVKVDEKGTEAAAATAIGAPGGGPPPKPLEMRVDRPFVFLILDKATGLIMFIGRVTEPKEPT